MGTAAINQYATDDYDRLEPAGTNLSKVVSSGAVTMSPEMFEKVRTGTHMPLTNS